MCRAVYALSLFVSVVVGRMDRSTFSPFRRFARAVRARKLKRDFFLKKHVNSSGESLLVMLAVNRFQLLMIYFGKINTHTHARELEMPIESFGMNFYFLLKLGVFFLLRCTTVVGLAMEI